MSMPPPSETRPYDVAVVGAGPIGLAAAQLLLTQGVTVAVIDPNVIVCQHPRATHLDDETMRTFQLLGLAGFEPGFLRQTEWKLHGRNGAEFLELATPNEPTDQGWNPDYQHHQPDFESALRGFIHAAGGDLMLGWEVTAFDQDENDVHLQVQQSTSHRQDEVRARYVVAADGAGSFMREHLDVTVEDLEGTQTSLIVDIHPFEHPKTLPQDTGFILCEKDLPVTYCPIGPPRLRFEFMLREHHDAAAMAEPSNVYRLLSRWIEPGSYRILRTDAYEWHAHLADTWRAGRILLAGDAAHEMPPMLGQGMCCGLRDSMNLAWKLALVAQGLAPTRLLDTYESERSAHVRPYIVESARQSSTIWTVGHEGTPPASSEREVVEQFRPLLGPGLIDAPQPPVSQLAPQPLGEDGSRLDDTTGYRFTIVGAPDVIGAVSDETRQLWERLDAVVLGESGAPIRDWLGTHGALAAIIRPDRYTWVIAKDAAQLDRATHELIDRVLLTEVPA